MDRVTNVAWRTVGGESLGGIAYEYDALGRRMATTNAEGMERHVWDGDHCLADVDEEGNVLRAYLWGPGVDNLLAVRVGGRNYAALTDIRGTIWGYADERGEIVARWTYDAWGNVLSEEIVPLVKLRCPVRCPCGKNLMPIRKFSNEHQKIGLWALEFAPSVGDFVPSPRWRQGTSSMFSKIEHKYV